jgi:cytochrome c oxidase assembly protein Cox11
MPWTFTPTQDYVTVHPGESVLAFFTAHNTRCVAVCGPRMWTLRILSVTPADTSWLQTLAIQTPLTHHRHSPKAITGVSTYNVVPDQAAYYFNKV